MIMTMSLDEAWLWADEADRIASSLTGKYLSLLGIEGLRKGMARVGPIH